ncbi:MAG: hypothetical protein HYW15_01060 [Candidatus Giovannonibacteria bacterium]|nr:MAG: hypothetical protein HYW15_01060 [Candidatus Giovannonibacteria bacterium]
MAASLKTKIMRRVYAIWFVRRVLPTGFASAFFMNVALKKTAERFFVSQIFANFYAVAKANIWAVPNFIASAFNNVEPSVLVLISIAGLLGFSLAIELWRSVRSVAAGAQLAALSARSK